MWRLTCISSTPCNGPPLQIPLGQSGSGLVFVGRDSSNEISLPWAATVERWRHAVICSEPSSANNGSSNIRLKDLGSSSGTFVNGRRLCGGNEDQSSADATGDQWTLLREGDQITFGSGEGSATFCLLLTQNAPNDMSSRPKEERPVNKSMVTAIPATLYLTTTASGEPASSKKDGKGGPPPRPPPPAIKRLLDSCPQNFQTQEVILPGVVPAASSSSYLDSLSHFISQHHHQQQNTSQPTTVLNNHSIGDVLPQPTSNMILVGGANQNSKASTSSSSSLISSPSVRSSNSVAASMVLDALIKDVQAASYGSPKIATAINHHPQPQQQQQQLTLDSGFGDSLDAIVSTANQNQPQTSAKASSPPVVVTSPPATSISPPVRDVDEDPQPVAASRVPAPTVPPPPAAFTIDFSTAQANDVEVGGADRSSSSNTNNQHNQDSVIVNNPEQPSASLSVGDSLSKFLPEHLRRKQQQQEAERERSRELLARELAEKQQQQQKKSKKSSSATKSGSKASPALSPRTATTKASVELPEHSFYKESALHYQQQQPYDNGALQDDNGDMASECGTYTIAVEDPAKPTGKSPSSHPSNNGGDDEDGQAWQTVMDKFFASSAPGSNQHHRGSTAAGEVDPLRDSKYDCEDVDDDDVSVTPSASPSVSNGGSALDMEGTAATKVKSGSGNSEDLEAEIDRLAQERAVNISLQNVASASASSVPVASVPQPQPKPQQPKQSNTAAVAAAARNAAMFASPVPSRQQPALSQTSAARLRPQSATATASTSSGSSTATIISRQRQQQQTSQKTDAASSSLLGDSLSTELLLGDTEQVLKSLQLRQLQREQQKQQQPQQMMTPVKPIQPPSQLVRGDVQRRSLQAGERYRPQAVASRGPAAASSRASSTNRSSSNTLNAGSSISRGGSRSSNLDDSSSDIYSGNGGGVRLFLTRGGSTRLPSTSGGGPTAPTAASRARQRVVPVQQSDSMSSYSAPSATDSPRLQSRQSLGTKIVLKSRTNAQMDQFRGVGAQQVASSASQRSSRTKLNGPVAAAAKTSPADEQRQRELEAWRRRKTYDARKSVAEQKRSSRCSSLSRQSVEFDQQASLNDEDDGVGPREISYEDFYGTNDDEFILVYDDAGDDGTAVTSCFESTSLDPTPRPPPPAHINGQQVRQSSNMPPSTPQQQPPSANSITLPSTPSSQYQQLKDGRRVMVLTGADASDWSKLPVTSPPQQPDFAKLQQSPIMVLPTSNSNHSLTGNNNNNVANGSNSRSAMTTSTISATSPSAPVMRTSQQVASASLERVDSLILSSVYRLAAKLTDRASAAVGKPAPMRSTQQQMLTSSSSSSTPNNQQQQQQPTLSTESQLVGTLTELHRLERLVDEMADLIHHQQQGRSPQPVNNGSSNGLPMGYRSTTAAD